MKTLNWVVLICVALLFYSTVKQESKTETIPLAIPMLNHTEPTVNYEVQEAVRRYIYDWSPVDMDAEIDCLAKNIYFEGRGESLKGQIGIALVTINRVIHNKFPDSICEVVHQQGNNRSGVLVAQFSWTLDGKSDRPTKGKTWDAVLLLAKAMTADGSIRNIHDFTNGSTHYHATYVQPGWVRLIKSLQIDKHIYYRYPHNKHHVTVAMFM